MFESVDEAKAVAASIVGVDPESFEDDPSLCVGGIEVGLLDDPDTSEEIKREIRARLDTQKGFKTTKNGEEIRIVIGPFRSGFDCWFISKNGFGMRI
jgi:hypothetical protein